MTTAAEPIPPRNKRFHVGTTILSGRGSLGHLGDVFTGLDARRIAVVADHGIERVGLLWQILGAAGSLPIAHTALVMPNPDVAAVESIVSSVRRAQCDAVLAIGGGSALGAAKAVAIRLNNPGPITAYEGVDRVPTPPVPTVAVPTTAGSGSEVSNALVLHEPGWPREIIVRGQGCEPRVAILDASVLRGLPRTPMIESAVDALSHAFEALWAKGRSMFTDALAVRAADTIIRVLPRALDERDDTHLQLLLDASSAANLACGNSGLGLVHALSSAPSIPLSHGHQNGALLLPVARFNAQHLDAEYRPLIARAADLFDRIGFAARFTEGELDHTHLAAMLAASSDHPFRSNNIRESTDDDVIAILHEAGVAKEETSQ
ncbi:iron-containing alcohol dehydrogenase family protein [Streptomyces sp. NPDC020801]|uniref:iron-containing alcohol dehydrogenase family protein n=1 Tax=unclassified Streptomyces TaxID=2593676 RepID=UPI003790EE06